MTRNRATKAATAAAAVLALALLATGCSGDNTAAPVAPTAPVPTATSAESGAPTPAASLGTPTAQPTASYKPFTGPVAERFGADKVMQGYLLATKAVMDTAFDSTLVNIIEPRQVDLSAIEKDMTDEAAALWRERSAKIEAGTASEQEYEDAFALATWAVPTLVEGGQPVENPIRDAGFGEAQASVGQLDQGNKNIPTLVLNFPVKGTILLKDKNGQVLSTVLTKDMSVALVQTGVEDRPWAISNYVSSRNLTDPVPYTGK